ncbi:helix-turn-helix transcriptional regulator [Parabacteroides sp. AF17-28]|uniref:helix-turn-helix domain-containing protein n=1 Tax=Parabacteroides sp. AF17-28 TaxID=2292241 RepID=UPI000F003750|nr:helix-turn-helix transcriptional regulator [Parabacteroides sp. AF17-28]RHR58865.1 XRE family transcriptional regulator [Parabacteroides sp. AF17-28]
MKVRVFIERGNDGYSAYMPDDNNLPFGLVGDGNTAKEAISDFNMSCDEMRDFFREEGKEFPDIEFEFSYDVPSFIAYYSDKLSLAGLSRITGVNQGQLSHYLTGRRHPSEKTARKIQEALHNFGKEISQISFV